MKKYFLKSPAKINLTLEIIGKRQDGYHRLRSVMLKVEKIYDEIDLVIDEKKDGINIRCANDKVPTDDKNICWKITEKFFKTTGKIAGIAIKIKKCIPISAGMGGGSSNGASVLMALNDFFGKPLGVKRLLEVGAEIGKDIPFFLGREKIAGVSGVGDILRPIPYALPYYFLIVSPNVEISTADAYAKLDKNLWFIGDKRRKNVTAGMISAIRKENDISSYMHNDFKSLAVETCPEIEIILESLIAFGSRGAGVTGKGPTIFGVFQNRKEAEFTAKKIKKHYPKYFIAVS